MRKELWKSIVGYEGLYEVSNLGRVMSLNYNGTGRTQVMKPSNDKDGYLQVKLCKDGKIKRFFVHRLVAMAFIPNPNNLPQVNHINEMKDDNRVENLEWCDSKYNTNYGTAIKRRAEKQTNGKKSKPVMQYTLDGEFIREWPSVMECQRNGFCLSSVSACCRGINKQHKGYIWRYKE